MGKLINKSQWAGQIDVSTMQMNGGPMNKARHGALRSKTLGNFAKIANPIPSKRVG